jgi:hypothetical protein
VSHLHTTTPLGLPKSVWALALVAAAGLLAGGVSCAVGSGATTPDGGGGGGDGSVPTLDGGADSTVDGGSPGHPGRDGSSSGMHDSGRHDAPTVSTEGGKTTEGGSHEGGGTGPAGIGGSCATEMCAPPGRCTTLGAGMYCTEPCPADGGACPLGNYCSLIGGVPLCVPDLGQECIVCTEASDCKIPSDNCLTTPGKEQFCARDCTVDSECPTGTVCANGADYSADGGLGPADAGDAGGMLSRWCVPPNGANCSCSAATNGATETCTITNQYGTCSKPAVCNGATGVWVGCQTPSAEICNGMDDNCSGQIDEGNPDTLCAFMGSPPPNANWACTNGTCTLGTCDPGWANFLDAGTVASGCTCTVNPAEPNATCAQATNKGSISSTGGGSLVITSTLSSPTDVNVWSFASTDVAQTGTNSYNVTINFTEPTPNNEFRMDVERSSTCADAPTGGATDITSYTWCVNASNADAGELVCGPTAIHHCNDDGSQYYVRVHRAAGVTPTCTPYQLTITGGGTACTLGTDCN